LQLGFFSDPALEGEKYTIHQKVKKLPKSQFDSFIYTILKEVWLSFEKEIKVKSTEKSLISYQDVYAMAERCGIYDEQEVLQAIRFLNDLGSLQYFETNGLKNNIVINPQVRVLFCFQSSFFEKFS
jgi:hypothetical protein